MATSIVGVISLSACSDTEPWQPDTFADEAIPEWRFVSTPEWIIGGIDASEGYSLTGIAGALLFEDRVVVADRGSREMRFYDLAGRLILRSGGLGSGPGEFRSIQAISRAGWDRIAVWDGQLQRVVFFDLEGQHLGSTSPRFDGHAVGFLPRFIGSLPDGRLVYREGSPVPGLGDVSEGERRDSVSFFLMEQDGDPSGIVHRVRGPETQLWREATDGMTSWGIQEVIFGRSTFAVVSGTDLVIAVNDSLEFERFDRGVVGGQRAVLPWRPRPVSRRDVEAEQERLIMEVRTRAELDNRASLGGVPLGQLQLSGQERAIRQSVHRGTWPAFEDIRGDPLGRTWVAESGPAVDGLRRWLVLDPSFTPIARLTIPDDYEILDLDVDALLILSRDVLGVESVALHAIGY